MDGSGVTANELTSDDGGDPARLEGRRAVVTGAGQGVGAAIAVALAAAGAEVLVNDLSLERANRVVERITAASGSATAAVFDVTDHAGVNEALAGAAIDILVNNAGNAGGLGMTQLAPFVETVPADWEPYLAVNLYGVMHCTRAVLPAMIAGRWGRVVTIVSDAGRTGDGGMAAYAAAKAGAAGFIRAIASEVGRYGVTANAVALGTMRTEFTEAFWRDGEPERQRAILRNYTVRRPGSPADVAGLVGFLCSPAAAWITGQTYPVNGGSSYAM